MVWLFLKCFVTIGGDAPSMIFTRISLFLLIIAPFIASLFVRARRSRFSRLPSSIFDKLMPQGSIRVVSEVMDSIGNYIGFAIARWFGDMA